jgi:hypothetical protein
MPWHYSGLFSGMKSIWRSLIVGLLLSLVAQGNSAEVQPLIVRGRTTPKTFGEPVAVNTDQKVDRTKLELEARRLLASKDYDHLDARAQELNDSKAIYPNGYTRLSGFYLGLSTPKYNAVDEDYKARIDELKSWVKARPNSVLASVALARCWHDYALLARGPGMANTVSKSQWKTFSDRLAEGRAVLDASKPLRTKLPIWYATALRIGFEQQMPRKNYDELHLEAIKAFPDYFDFYGQQAYYLTPIWNGQSGDVEQYLERIANHRSGEDGDVFYAQLVWSLREAKAYNNLYYETRISWPRVRNGFTILMKRNPHSIEVATEFCYEAIQAEDHVQARKLFEDEIGDQAVMSVWNTRTRFIGLRKKVIGE